MNSAGTVRILGLDPGLRCTGWGVIESSGNRLRHIANNSVTSDGDAPLAERLRQIFSGLEAVIAEWRPDAAAVEETFVNKNPSSTLKLGQARGVALLAPAVAGLPVHEYAPNQIKKTVVGSGHAAKQQILAMVEILLGRCDIAGPDAADALAVALCHAQHIGAPARRAADATHSAKARPAGVRL